MGDATFLVACLNKFVHLLFLGYEQVLNLPCWSGRHIADGGVVFKGYLYMSEQGMNALDLYSVTEKADLTEQTYDDFEIRTDNTYSE